MQSELYTTVKIPLYVDDTTPLIETMERFRDAYNYISEQVSYLGNDENPTVPGKYKIQKLFYQTARKQFGLKAQLSNLVCWAVAANYKTFCTQIEESKLEVERWQKRKAEAEAAGRRYGKRKPKVIKWHALVCHKPFCRMSHERSWNFLNESTVSINTLGKRMKCSFPEKYMSQYMDREFGEAQLSLNKGRVYLLISVKEMTDVPDESEINLETATITGVDLGQRSLYVAYDGKKTTYCDGGLVKNKRVHAAEKRSELQRKCTPSSKRRLVSMAGRENRYVECVNHTIAKALVKSLNRGDVLVLEDLSNLNKKIWVRKGQRYLSYSWSYSSLRSKIDYKAKRKGVTVIYVSPDKTSITCPCCGTVRESNRNHNKHEYKCECGYRGNDDRTAAMNIRQRGIDEIRKRQQSAAGKPAGRGPSLESRKSKGFL